MIVCFNKTSQLLRIHFINIFFLNDTEEILKASLLYLVTDFPEPTSNTSQ